MTEYDAINVATPPEPIGFVPQCCTLAGFAAERGCVDGVSIQSLDAGTEVEIHTLHSTYHLTVLDPDTRRVSLKGGALFREGTEARIAGATAGGCALKLGWIGVGLRMEITEGTLRATTSLVTSIIVGGAPRAHAH